MAGANPKLALFGGTFDPVHQGHMVLGRAATVTCSLDRVIFIPCHQSPHKQGVQSAPGADRFSMLKAATHAEDWAEVSDYELNQSGPSYSWQTTLAMQDAHPGAELHWILGADQWDVIEKWAHPEILAEHLHFIVFPREGSALPAPKDGFRATFLRSMNPASATAIRLALAGGAKASEQLLHPKVAAYIEDHGLYRRAD